MQLRTLNVRQSPLLSAALTIPPQERQAPLLLSLLSVTEHLRMILPTLANGPRRRTLELIGLPLKLDKHPLLTYSNPLLTPTLLHRQTQSPDGRQHPSRKLKNRLQASLGTILGLLLDLMEHVPLGNREPRIMWLSIFLGEENVFPTLPQIILSTANLLLGLLSPQSYFLRWNAPLRRQTPGQNIVLTQIRTRPRKLPLP